MPWTCANKKVAVLLIVESSKQWLLSLIRSRRLLTMEIMHRIGASISWLQLELTSCIILFWDESC